MNDEHTRILSPAIRTAGMELLDHQCWAFGRDILYEGGNLILQYGFARVRCPQGGLSQYELCDALGLNCHVYLWGFGAFFGNEREGIFLARKGFTPFRTQGRVELHDRDFQPYQEQSSDLELLRKGIGWFAAYEDWIDDRMGPLYRPETLQEFPRRTLLQLSFATRWRELAREMAEQRQDTEGDLRPLARPLSMST